MRPGLALLGAALVVAGAILVASPDLGNAFSTTFTPPILAAMGLAVALVGAAIAAGPSASDADSASFANVAGSADDADSGAVFPSPDDNLLGAELDATLARLETMSALELRRSNDPDEVRERLRPAAIAMVVARDGVDDQTAAEIVERGAWTDDPVAAAFLSTSLRAPFPLRLRERWAATPRVVARARRTVEALEALEGSR